MQQIYRCCDVMIT